MADGEPKAFDSEELLKACVVLALCFACALPAKASPAAAEDLVVGSVRDPNGRPIANALVRATDAEGRLAGNDRTDGLGTFAIHLVRAASALEIRCRHCRPERVAVTAGANVAIVMTRYVALESDLPDTNDLAALPYGRSVDALALVPFVLTAPDGSAVSDRGLGGGHGLVADDGAALADLATGGSALIDLPDRSLRHLAVTRANEAFRYGPYAGGGVFGLDSLGDAPAAALDVGQTSALALAPLLGTLHPAFGVSSDAGVLARRGDVDLATPFAGGALRAGVTNASERVATSALAIARDLAGARLAYATASQRYRTFVDLATSRVVVAESGGTRIDYASAYGDGGFRLEYPGAITLAAGVRATQQSASYDRYLPPASALDGRANSLTLSIEGHAGDDRTRVDAGLGSAIVSTRSTVQAVPAAATERALLPSLALRSRIAGGLYARAGFSESLRLAALLESVAQPLQATPAPLERGELQDGALGFDAGGRLRAEAIVYREFTRGGADRRLDGVGASVAWQIAPLVSLRAWSLKIDPLAVIARPYAVALPVSRQVLWASFDRRDALRLDAILHRDAGSATRAVIALDGDVLVRVGSHLAIDLTTSRRDGVRRYAAGLRAR